MKRIPSGLIISVSILSIVLILVGFPFAFTEHPEWMFMSIIGVGTGGIALVLNQRNKQMQAVTENKMCHEPVFDQYQVRRKCLYQLEYKLIPTYIEVLKIHPDIEYKLIDISCWEKDIASLVPAVLIDWDEISCEIVGDMNSEFVILYEFPKPFDTPLAKYGAVYINKQKCLYGYYTLEMSLSGFMLCSTTTDKHTNYGSGGDLSKMDFLKELCTIVGIDINVLQGWRLAKSKKQQQRPRDIPEYENLLRNWNDLSEVDNMEEITDSNIQRIIKSKRCIVICFYDLIGPSKSILPILSDIAKEYNDYVKVGIYNVYGNDNEKVRVDYKITAMPTFLFIINGIIAKRHIGVCSAGSLREWFDELIAM
jgi:hypothetical protein